MTVSNYLRLGNIKYGRRYALLLFLLLVLLMASCATRPPVDFHVGNFETPLTADYLSPVIETVRPMDRAILSWNVMTPGDSSVQFYLRARPDSDEWSPWFTMGVWGSGIKRHSVSSQKNRFGSVDIDTLLLSLGASQWQYRFELRQGSGGELPQVYAVSLAAKDSASYVKRQRSTVMTQEPLRVPQLSQFDNTGVGIDPELAERICSPASATMLLRYLGAPVAALPDFAQQVYDYESDLFGNWPFNTATIFQVLESQLSKENGDHYLSYVRWFESLDDLIAISQSGIPVIVSIEYKEGELDGAPRPTIGHILVVRGADESFVYVNDPAAPTHDTVARKYRRDQFLAAWKGVAYVTEKLPR